MLRYWKANKDTAKQITAFMSEWDDVKKAACKLARKVGATTRTYRGGYTTLEIQAFRFKDESKIDTTQWCRLKGTHDGWRPRRNGSELQKPFAKLRSDFMGKIMDLIGMNLFGPNLRCSTPGIAVVGDDVFLVTPADVNVKGCRRITDVQYERAVKNGEPANAT